MVKTMSIPGMQTASVDPALLTAPIYKYAGLDDYYDQTGIGTTDVTYNTTNTTTTQTSTYVTPGGPGTTAGAATDSIASLLPWGGVGAAAGGLWLGRPGIVLGAVTALAAKYAWDSLSAISLPWWLGG